MIMAQFWEQRYYRRCCQEESPTILIMLAVQVDAAFCIIIRSAVDDIRRTTRSSADADNALDANEAVPNK